MGKKKNRPNIKFEIFQTADKSIWKVFAKHHYLSHSHNNAAMVFSAFLNDQLCGMCSVLHLPHPVAKTIKKVHRLVILPDYQGLGIGIRFLNEIGKYYVKNGWRFTIVTSAPSLMFGLKKDKNWSCKHFGRMVATSGILHGSNNKGTNSKHRLTTSWELK